MRQTVIALASTTALMIFALIMAALAVAAPTDTGLRDCGPTTMRADRPVVRLVTARAAEPDQILTPLCMAA